MYLWFLVTRADKPLEIISKRPTRAMFIFEKVQNETQILAPSP